MESLAKALAKASAKTGLADVARRVLLAEADAIRDAVAHVGESFEQCAATILNFSASRTTEPIEIRP